MSDFLETHPSPTCITLSNLVAIVQPYVLVGSQKFWWRWVLAHLRWGRVWPLETRSSPRVLSCHISLLWIIPYGDQYGFPKILVTISPCHSRWVFPPHVLPRQIWSFCIRRLESKYADSPGKFNPLRTAFQGHSKSRIDWLPMTSY